MQDQGIERNPSSSSSSNSSNGSNIRACSIISAPSKRSLDLLTSYLDDVLSAIIDKGPHSNKNDSEIKLKDIVQPIASDFSKLLEGISQGANIFSDQKSSTSKLSSEVETVALDLLKGLGKAHWVAAGLLVIANVLERFDKISSNNRECTDLLRGMLDLAKFIKRLKDINADFHKDILEKMKEAVHLVVSGAILCHSFITCNKISKFVLTTKIREELVYVRGKVDRIIWDLGIQTELTILSTLTFYMSRQQQHNDNEGGTEETRYPTEDFALQQGNLGGANIHCENEEICETQTHKMEMQSDTESSLSASNGQVEYDCYNKQLPFTDNSKRKNGNQPQAFLPRLIARPARMLKTIAHGLNKINGHKFEGQERSVHSDLGITLDENQLSSFAIQHGFGCLPIRISFQELKIATNGFQKPLGAGGFGCVYKGILANGRQVVVKRGINASQGARLAFMNELVYTSKLYHRHIIKLVGFWNARKEQMLVYDYMPHGSLSDFLFDPIKKQVLDWRKRLNVMLEIISALAYLHEDGGWRIVHRDIKPGNILLDENFSARIADFGISTALQDNIDFKVPIAVLDDIDFEIPTALQDNIDFEIPTALQDNIDFEIPTALQGQTHMTTAVRGTIGYIAPEYLQSGQLSEKCDIYSFGILVLNVVSGQQAFDLVRLANDDDVMLVEWARMLQKENRLIELIDPELVKGPGFDSGDILRTIMIALLCTQSDPDLRPPASRVLVMLSTKEVEIPTAPAPPESEVSSSCSSPLSVLTDSLDDNVCSSVFNSPPII